MNLGNDAVYDDRNGRQEDVPTTDINLWQYGLEETWLAVINFYVYPRKCTFFPGHPGLDTGGHFFTVRYRLFFMRSTHYFFCENKMWLLIVIGFTFKCTKFPSVKRCVLTKPLSEFGNFFYNKWPHKQNLKIKISKDSFEENSLVLKVKSL